MKFLALALMLTTIPAFALPFTGKGKYVLAHDIAFLRYADAKDCQADGGRWENDLCFMAASDEVNVTIEEEITKVQIETITTNAHSCSFQGDAAFNVKGQLVSKVDSQTWDGKDWKPSVCEVTLTFVNANKLNVTTGENCSYFCGMNASLEVEGAERKAE